jgi:mono/diheme cytochrome c family protein
MKRFYVILVFLTFIIPFLPAMQTSAMPEYATRVGEPCGSCHTSAAGGGLRNPRGQAWVAQGKLNTVPTMDESLKILGVKVTTNPADYVAPPPSAAAQGAPAPAAPLPTRYERKVMLLMRLLEYDGN